MIFLLLDKRFEIFYNYKYIIFHFFLLLFHSLFVILERREMCYLVSACDVEGGDGVH